MQQSSVTLTSDQLQVQRGVYYARCQCGTMLRLDQHAAAKLGRIEIRAYCRCGRTVIIEEDRNAREVN